MSNELREDNNQLRYANARLREDVDRFVEALKRVRRIIADRSSSDAVNAMTALAYIDTTIGRA